MATNKEYLAQGYSQDQINKALSGSGMGLGPSSATPINPPQPTTTVADSVGGPNFVAPVAQPQADLDFNARQKAFDAANPLGTAEAIVNRNIAPEAITAAKESITFNPTTATQVSKPTKTPSESTKNGQETPVVNFDSSVGREAEINANLARISQENPNLLTDRSKFDSAFGYTTADIGKKALLDSFFDQGRKNAETLWAIKKYSNYSVSDFSYDLANWKISNTTKGYLSSDPVATAKIKKAEDLNRINGKKVDPVRVGEETTKEVLNANPTVSKALSDNELTAEEVKALTTSPETALLEKDMRALKDKLDIVKNSYENIENEAKKEFANTWITKSALAQIISNRRKDILPELNLLETQYGTKFDSYAEKKKEALALLNTNLGLYKDAKVAEAEKAKIAEQRAYEEQKLKDKNIYDSINSQIDFAMKNGVDLQRTDANVVIADAKKYATQYGVSLEQAIKDTFVVPLTSKDSWKKAVTNIKDKAESGKFTLGFDPITGTPYSFDTKTGEAKSVSSGGFVRWGVITPGGTQMRTDRHNNPVAFTTDIAAQAGLVEWVDYSIGDPFGDGKYNTARIIGDPIDTTIKVIDKIGFTTKAGAPRWSYTPKLGLTNEAWAKMDRTQKTAAIYKMYQNEGGSGELFRNGEEIPTQQNNVATFTPIQKSIFDKYDSDADADYKKTAGYAAQLWMGVEQFTKAFNDYKNAPVSTDGLNKDGYNPVNEPLYAKWNSGKMTDADKKKYDNPQFKKEALAYGQSKKREGIPSVNELVNSLRILRDFGKATRVSAQIPWAWVLSWDAAKFKSIYDQVIAQSALDNLLKLKADGATFGALSDNEMRYIKSASTSGQLTFDLTDADWKRKIDDLITRSENVKNDIVWAGYSSQNVGNTNEVITSTWNKFTWTK